MNKLSNAENELQNLADDFLIDQLSDKIKSLIYTLAQQNISKATILQRFVRAGATPISYTYMAAEAFMERKGIE